MVEHEVFFSFTSVDPASHGLSYILFLFQFAECFEFEASVCSVYTVHY